MKRPSGFDRQPEEPRLPDTPVPEARDEPVFGGSQVFGAEPERGAFAETGIAPTVDLSEVRDAREHGDSLTRGDVVKGSGVAPSSSSRSLQGLLPLRGSREPDPMKQAERRVREAGRRRRAQERRESRRFSAAARRRRRTWWIVLGTVGALALFVAVGVFTPLMAVRDIQLVGASSVDRAQVEKALARFDGVPIALVNEADVYRALEPFPLIQSYAVELIPPRTLIVRIEERLPVVSIERNGAFELYDAAGVLIGSAQEAPPGVPVGSGPLTDLSSPAFVSAAQVLRDIPAELRAQVASVTASSGQDVTLVLASGVEVLWGDDEQNLRKALVLQRMIASLEAAGRAVEHIDVSSSEAPVFR